MCSTAIRAGEDNWEAAVDSLRRTALKWIKESKCPTIALTELEANMLQVQSQTPTPQMIEQNKSLKAAYNSHLLEIERRRQNIISCIHLEDGTVIIDEKQIRQSFVNHFKGIYAVSEGVAQPSLPQGVTQSIPRIQEVETKLLTALPTVQEIMEAVFAIYLDKASGLMELMAK